MPGIRSLRCHGLEPPATLSSNDSNTQNTTRRRRIRIGCTGAWQSASSRGGGGSGLHNVLIDGDTHCVDMMPNLHKPKKLPISLFSPVNDDGDGSLFIMERVLYPVGRGLPCPDLELLDFRQGRVITCQLLPPPPYVHEPSYRGTHRTSKIISYAMVGDGSLLCISVNGKGTYVTDTATRAWSRAGDWMLPFRGKVEYVPDLKLWFGFSADDARCLAAADLSTMDMDSQPQLVGCWHKELHDPPEGEEWMEHQDAKLVYLGSGKFCLARFFLKWVSKFGFKQCHGYLDSFNGVEVVPRGFNDREVELEMIPHKTRYHTPVNQVIIEKFF
ncbi:hypothetical protein U9M48_026210 [Paspalum notatum var. saurae]|uniref:Uncharacterized protein n=1 Tax=Paspalum notatum var. saurae TaxID=547442 RepID=A0AAQ3WY42_PASNO